MASVSAVAFYLASEQGIANKVKLHKVLYYCQAWSLVWDGHALFDARFEAWHNGPVCAEVWRAAQLVPGPLTLAERETIDAVVSLYGKFTGTELTQLSHSEVPWLTARQGLAPDERSDVVITTTSMRDFYSRYPNGQKSFDVATRNAIEELASLPLGTPPLADDQVVDAEPFVQWLETGEGNPWARFRSSLRASSRLPRLAVAATE